MERINYTILDQKLGILNVSKSENTFLFNYPCVSTITCTPYYVFIPKGVYRMSLWGAQGGNSRDGNSLTFLEDSGGKGAFVSGKIRILQDSNFFLYVGGKGEDLISKVANSYGKGGFNGGGNGGYDVGEEFGESNSGGGGASDIRLIGNDSIEGLKSRIIVSGGGGSRIAEIESTQTITDSKGTVYQYTSTSGDAGTLEGYSTSSFTVPGTQTSGSFGKGMHGVNIDRSKTSLGGSIGGGGGGYYGGSHINVDTIGTIDWIQSSGAGGSSFVSGCKGCNAVSILPLNQVEHTNKNKHYSGYVFYDIIMKSGKDTFKDPQGKSETGHHGNGAILIEYINKDVLYTCVYRQKHRISVLSMIILVSCSFK